MVWTLCKELFSSLSSVITLVNNKDLKRIIAGIWNFQLLENLPLKLEQEIKRHSLEDTNSSSFQD